jgi:hypothetical protein
MTALTVKQQKLFKEFKRINDELNEAWRLRGEVDAAFEDVSAAWTKIRNDCYDASFCPLTGSPHVPRGTIKHND